jgi:mRNA-degrading endonuclease RelE of RelBE toxin-antitoxin system
VSYKIIPTPPFERELKKLSKKYPSLKMDIMALANELKSNPRLGISIGSEYYKIRMAIASKGKGKSGGARVITYVQVVHELIFLLAIYDKSEITTISNADIES